MASSSPDIPAVKTPEALDVRRILVRMGVGLVLLILIAGGLGHVMREPLMAVGKLFVQTLGGIGITVAFFIPDAFILPVPHEAFSAFGLLGGMAFWTVVAWGSLGSLSGGSVGFVIGRKLSKTAWFARKMEGKGEQVRALASKYGVSVLAFGAVSPLPYSITCWIAGASTMRYGMFMLVSLLRIPRIAFYLWLIEIGFVSAPG